jgi:glycosyltransferase involved in cell wall biosynthesis
VRVPGLTTLANKVLAKVSPFRLLALSHFFLAIPPVQDPIRHLGSVSLTPTEDSPPPPPSVSVIVPARNEVGNIRPLFERLPRMGSRTELVCVEGGSNDGTGEEIDRCRAAFPDLPCLHLKQTGQGKGDAVRLGFAKATGDILMILDSDLTVTPEDLPRFYEVLATGQGRFVNGVRLVYPMEGEAMRFLNFLANKFFSLAFSWVLSQPIKDTLCGTKALWRCDEREIAAGRAWFGDFDPFGDFDLLFGAAKRNLKIVEIPIRYRDRTYGSTKIDRWTHGWLLLRMVVFAARRIKFV